MTLTEREREILRGVMDGEENAAIAARLSISLGTVKTRLRMIYQKLGATGRAHAAAIGARRYG